MFRNIRPRHLFKLLERTYCVKEDKTTFSKRIFSAIQPTGEIHLGNYLGAIKKWVDFQDTNENVIYEIADLHSLTLPQDPKILRENIFIMTATLLAAGIDPNKSILFQQSSVHQHSELCWVFTTLATMPRLSQMPQFKEKTAEMKEILVGLFMYPVLQAADIALYKGTHVPIGQDQIHHLHLTNHLIRAFNRTYDDTFPVVTPVIDCNAGSIKNLLNPDKKMSKSHHPKTRINLMDPPDEILLKCKKAMTDCIGAVTYDQEKRPGVSNLVLIHSCLTNKSTADICREVENVNTGQYKLLLADVIIDSLRPIREKIKQYLNSREYLEHILLDGFKKASEIANDTMKEVKGKIGVGVHTRSDRRLKATLEIV